MTATCENCGAAFARAPWETWKHLCLNCWKDRKAAEVADLEAENTRLSHALEEARAALAARPGIEKPMLRRLLQLCHPDKHGGSEASHKAAAWLLDRMRKAPD